MAAIGALSEPFRITEKYTLPYFRSLDGKVVSTPRIVPAQRTLVIAALGQSNATNAAGSLYTPVNLSKIDNISLVDGGTYQAKDPLLGTSGLGLSGWAGNWLTVFADLMVSGGHYDRVILVPFAIGGTAIAEWAPGGAYNQNIVAACNRLSALGITPSAFIWMQGESDHGTSRVAYRDKLQSVINTARTAGIASPWLIGKCTYSQGVTDDNIRGACNDATNGTDIFAGADTDSLGSSYRRDNLHWNDAGMTAVAELWRTALLAVPL